MQLNSRWTCQSIRIFDLRPSYISCIYCGNHSWSFEPVCGLTVIMHIFGSITNRSTFNNESLGETLTPVLRFQSPESVEYQKCRSKFLWTRRRLATIARRFCHLVRKHGKLVAFGKFVFWMKQMKIMKILWHLSLQSHTPNVNYSSNQTKKKKLKQIIPSLTDFFGLLTADFCMWKVWFWHTWSVWGNECDSW